MAGPTLPEVLHTFLVDLGVDIGFRVTMRTELHLRPGADEAIAKVRMKCRLCGGSESLVRPQPGPGDLLPWWKSLVDEISDVVKAHRCPIQLGPAGLS